MTITELYQIYLSHPSVQTDTRKLQKGDIFFALKGPNFDGNAFAANALEAGAAYAVIDEERYRSDDRFIVVDDVLNTLQLLANHHRKQLDIPFIAITGSNGKTTTKELINTVLSIKYKTVATKGNLNNHIGVPLTLLSIPADTEIAIIEMGANHQKEIASYCRIAEPTHGLINNCGKAHIEGFGGIEGVRKGKGELYDFLRENKGIIFRNKDLDYLKDMATGIEQQITYGSANADYIGKPLMDDVFLNVAVLNSGAETTLKTNLVGSYNFPNVMAAVAIGMHFHISIDEIKAAIASYSPDNSRSQWSLTGSNKVILDAYNANPTSMRAAIINFATADLTDKILWLGGMKEMGPTEKEEHAALVALINEYEWKEVILVGKEFNNIEHPYKWFETSTEAAEHVRNNKPTDSAILIKGSRSTRMELLQEAIA